MKLVYLKTVSIIDDLLWAFKQEDLDITYFSDGVFSPLVDDKDLQEKLDSFLSKNEVDIVYSYFFIPRVSDICEANGIFYLSWTYDSIYIPFYNESIMNKHNITLAFDKLEAEGLRGLGAPNVFYMPLCANLTRIGQLVISKEDEKKYASEVSFIGNLYDTNNYNEVARYLDDETLAELNGYLIKNTCKWDCVKEWPVLSKRALEVYDQLFKIDGWNDSEMPDELYFGVMILTRKLAEMDRITILNTLAERYNVDFYTKSKNENIISKVNVHKSVDYNNEMSKIFYLSKINLNITLPSIRSGIPQRVFDVMGCGGFMLTNHQQELEELFTIGKEIETFKSLPECIDKVEYYLNHEKQRQGIAINGYKAIREFHTINHRMQEIIKIVNCIMKEIGC